MLKDKINRKIWTPVKKIIFRKQVFLITAIIIVVFCGGIYLFKNILLQEATANNDIDKVKFYFSIGADVNKSTLDGVTPLMLAAGNGNIELLQLFLDKGAQIDAVNIYDSTALMYASRYGKEEVVRFLLSHKADPNLVNENSSTALILALENKHMEIVKILLDNGADPNIGNPLVKAIKNGNMEGVKLLISKGSDPNILSSRSQNPLLVAISKKNKDAVKLLINAGADVNVNEKKLKEYGTRDEVFVTPLLAAISANDSEIVKILLQKGAHVNTRFRNISDGWTYLMEASRKENKEIINLLVKYGANLNAKNASERTAFCQALFDLKLEAAKTLLKNGSKSYCRYYDEEYGAWITEITPLMIAAEQGDLELAKMLVARGHRPDHSTEYAYENEVMAAATHGHIDVFRYLANYESQDVKQRRGCDLAAIALFKLELTPSSRRAMLEEWDRMRCYRWY